MVDREVALEKLTHLQHCQDRLKPFLRTSPGRIGRDLTAQDVVFRNLPQAVQCCVDLGAHILADEGWGVSESQAGIFEQLSRRGVFPPALARRLIDLVKLRNKIIHEYVKVSPGQISRDLDRHLRTLSAFARSVIRRFRLRAGA